MRKRQRFARALLVKDISAVSAVMFSVCEGEGGPASHANITVCPFGWCAAVDHAAGYVGPGRELEAFSLQGLIYLVDICQIVSAL